MIDSVEGGSGSFSDSATLLEWALQLHENNELAKAAKLFLKILDYEPCSFIALHQMGVIKNQCGEYEAAIGFLEKALKINRKSALAHLNIGNSLWNLHRDEEALSHFEYSLIIQPNNPETLLNCAAVLQGLQRHEEAFVRLEKHLRIAPDSREGLRNGGMILHQLGRDEEALAYFERAIELDPLHAGTLIHRGNLLLELLRLHEAITSYDLALKVDPGNLVAQNGRANALKALGRFKEALEGYDQALRIHPDNADLLSNKSNTLRDLNRLSEALKASSQALIIQPKNVNALLSQGVTLLDLKKPLEALTYFDLAMNLAPENVLAVMNRGTALHVLGRHQEAIIAFEKALEISPTYAALHSNKIFLLDYMPETDIKDHQRERNAFYQSQAKRFENGPPTFIQDRNPDRPLVLGYVSADFKHHSAAGCFEPVLKHHDKAHFKIVCYSGSVVEDSWTQRFKTYADSWKSTLGFSDDEMAAEIVKDGIDVLIDLSGHSKGNRLLVFARKPAPIQVTAWGHAGGTGLPMVDYQFTDPIFTPEETRCLFAETSYDLPCFITFEAPSFAPEVVESPAAVKGFTTFGSLNRFAKVTPEALDLWARILQAVPGSRMVLKDAVLDDPLVQNKVKAIFSRRGVGQDRIDMLGGTSHQKHLEAYHAVDIVLDTFPQNGGITTWEALWMGAPVVAILGNKPPSRISGAILYSLGLAEWVCGDEKEYLTLAINMASEITALAEFRRGIRKRISESPAGNPELYTRAVEEAYRTMWKRKMSK